MKLCWVKNATESRLVILAVRDRNGQPISFEPGECKQMLSATVNHPAVSVHIGRGLQLVEGQVSVEEVPKKKVLEVAISPAPPPAPKVEAPVVAPVVKAPVIQEAPATPVDTSVSAPVVPKEMAPVSVKPNPVPPPAPLPDPAPRVMAPKIPTRGQPPVKRRRAFGNES